MINKVISGGQTGADIGGLQAAIAFGIETGGWIPQGFLTENGPTPELAKFGLVETKSESWAPRTYANASDADGTIRFAKNFDSRGEICTLKAIKAKDKPYIDVNSNHPISIEEVVKWIKENNIQVLNVAGNRESVAPGIQTFTEGYLRSVFRLVLSED